MNPEKSTGVGNTPLVEIDGIYAKLECVNPTGSIKDRIVKFILDEDEKHGLLRKGMVIVEATSGNTGISLSYFGTRKGYEVRIVMPENMTPERKELIRRFGAKLILSSTEGSFSEAIRTRDAMVKEERCFTIDQFSNQLNTECHYRTTGKEIVRQLGSASVTADAFVAGVGTGGTLMGIAKALRETNAELHVAAVEPAESAVMSGGVAGPHDIAGIGDGFIPALVKNETGGLNLLIDEVIRIRSNDATEASMYISKKFGYCVGISSGANFLAAKKLSNRFANVVTVLPDGFNRYRSFGLNLSGRCTFQRGACQTLCEIPGLVKNR